MTTTERPPVGLEYKTAAPARPSNARRGPAGTEVDGDGLRPGESLVRARCVQEVVDDVRRPAR